MTGRERVGQGKMDSRQGRQVAKGYGASILLAAWRDATGTRYFVFLPSGWTGQASLGIPRIFTPICAVTPSKGLT